VGCLETVTTVPHEDLILCEALIVSSPARGMLACRPARE